MTNLYIQGLAEAQVVEASEYNLMALLKPKIFIDGDHWCVLYGQNIQDGVAGFGRTAFEAVLAFNAAWHVPAIKEPIPEQPQ